MKNRLVAVVVGLGFLAASLFAVSILYAEVADSFIIKSSLFKERKKNHIEFSHKKHNVDYKIGCAECHHIYKDGKNVFKEGDAVQKCESCHDVVKQKKECTDDEKKRHLQTAFHDNCKDCHKKMTKEGKDTGPVKCLECHPK